MTETYDFNTLANRTKDFSKKWDKDFIVKRYGYVPDDYISMWIADLDFELAPPIHKRFQDILSYKTFGYTYTYEEFYSAIQTYLSLKTTRHIPTEDIMLDYSIVNSIYHVIQSCVSPDGKVLINSPVYNPYREASDANNVAIIENNLVIQDDGRYHIDFTKLEEQIKDSELYILCSPHNPGGTVWSKTDLEKVAALCIEHDVVLVVDEAHSDHINRVEFTSILSLDEELLKNVVYLNSPNKPFNIAGLKTSYAVIPDKQLKEAFKHVLVKNHIDEPNVFGIAGLIAAYSIEGMNWAKQNYEYILDNYHWVESFVSEHLPEFKIMPLDATYVLWVDVTKTGMSGDEFTSKLATETGVLVQEGSSFGESGASFVRINIGTSKENVKEAFSRMNTWIHK